MSANYLLDLKDIAEVPVKSPVPRYGMGYEYHDWICPMCDAMVAYEPDIENMPARCRKCGQLLKKPKQSKDGKQDESKNNC